MSSTQYKMALVYEEQQEFMQAFSHCADSVAKAERVMGSDHPEVQKRRIVRDRLQHKAQAS